MNVTNDTTFSFGSFRYWISRQILYLSFKFRRWRLVRQMGKWIWVPKEQDDGDGTHSSIVSVDVLKNGELFRTLSMEEDWTLFEVREQLELQEYFDHSVFIHNGKIVRI